MLVGQKAIAVEALTSAVFRRATAVILQQQKDFWTAPPLSAIPPGLSAFGAHQQSRLLSTLDRLRDDRPDTTRRLFLAGTIPDADHITRELKKLLGADAGAHPQRLEAAGLASIGSKLGFDPTSLHDALNRARPVSFGAAPSKAKRAKIDRGVAELETKLAELARQNRRPGRDEICQERDSVTTSAVLDDNATLILRNTCEFPFDTSFVDVEMLEAYAKDGIRTVVVGYGVIVAERPHLADACERLGLNLMHVGD